MPDTLVRTVTIFVSSPMDVMPERGRVQAVVAKLNRQYEGLVRFETVLWEEDFYTADESFQPQIPDAVASDIVVSIFWTRIGTELPADFPIMPNGKPYPSGTAYELLTALEASKAKGSPGQHRTYLGRGERQGDRCPKICRHGAYLQRRRQAYGDCLR